MSTPQRTSSTPSTSSDPINPHKGRTGFDRIVHAAGYSCDGLAAAYRGESAFRQETWFAAVSVPLAFWLGQSWVETALLAGSVLLVLIVELLNTAVEATVDRISFELHDLAKRAKDFGSAAVLLSLLLCFGIWASALWHRFHP
jgi:diacylglycerol kinase (ATP)